MSSQNGSSIRRRLTDWELPTGVVTGRRALVLAGLLLIALNLRPAIASISPVLEQIRTDLGLSYVTVSLLITLPTICMGIFALTAAPIARRIGQERTVFWAVVLIGLATVARIAGSYVTVLFATTILVGVGIALIQALLPTLVEKYFPSRVALVTGLYTASLISGAAIAAGATAPLERVFGSWPAALASWGVLGVVAAVVWGPVVRGRRPATTDESDREETVEGKVNATQLPWRSRWAWVLALFYGGSAFLYFATLTWLAPFYQTLGWSEELSGFLLTVFTVAEIGGTLGVALLTDRSPDRRPALALTLGACALGFGAVAVIPLVSPWIWVVVAGVGIGGLFDLTLVLPIDYAPTPEATGRVSSMVISIGYLLSALGPVVIGGLRDLSGGYRVPFLVLVGICIMMFVVSLRFRPEDAIKL